MKLSDLKLYFDTLKFLKYRQIYWRLKYKLFKLRTPKVTIEEPKKWISRWTGPQRSLKCWDGETSFIFLGERGDLESQLDWRIKGKSDLWIYNLHYLDCLNSSSNSNLSQQTQLIISWINANQEINKAAWDPYCLSLRIVNLIKWCSRNAIYLDQIILSVRLQAEVLIERIEYDLLGNHLFANGKALIFAGSFLEGKTGQRFLEKGLEIIDKEINEQFLSDGAHYELSPMYHQILMWDICDLVYLAEVCKIDKLKVRCPSWRDAIILADSWRSVMAHPDGELAFFNDSAMEIAPSNDIINDFIKVLEINKFATNKTGFHDLKASGYFSISQAEGHRLLINACEISPTYQPGHSHADSLSFELSLYGNRLFVNSGISEYGISDLRQWQRSTSAHNTLTVKNRNSSQVWGGFRVAKRARIVKRISHKSHKMISVEAAHDGFEQQSIGGIHYRKWVSTPFSLTIEDKIKTNNNDSEVYFYLHPDVSIINLGPKSLVLNSHESEIVFEVSSGQLQILKSKWYPQFGASIDSRAIQVSNFYNSLTTSICWK